MYVFQKGEIPLFRAIWPFIAGIVTSIAAPGDLTILLLMFTGTVSLLLLYLFLSRKFQKYSLLHISSFLIYLALFLSGCSLAESRKQLPHKHHFSKHSADYLIVNILERPKVKNNVARFAAKVEQRIKSNKSSYVNGKILVIMQFDSLQQFPYRYGDQLLLKSKVSEIPPPYNPAEFNYREFLSYRHIHHQNFINVTQSRKLRSNQGNPIRSLAYTYQKRLVLRFERYLKFKETQAVAATLILGYRANLNDAIIQSYSKTGTMHILSVSGMHVAILVGILNILLSFLNKFGGGKIIRLFLTLAIIWTYWLVTGAAPSITRAAIMLSLLLIAKAKYHRVNSLNVLAFSAFLILLYNPFSIMDIGFQLSFFAVLGLLKLYPIIYKSVSWKNKIMLKIWEVISVSTAAQAATFIISVYHFHHFPLYFIISNLFVYIPVIVIMSLGFAFLTLGLLFTPVAKLLGLALDNAISITNKGLHSIENFPLSSIDQLWLSNLEIILLLIAFALLLLQAQRLLLKVSLVFIIVALIHSYHTLKHINQQKFMLFALRKNYAMAILDGRKAFILTDLDSLSSTFRFSVKPYLDSCRVQHKRLIDINKDDKNRLVRFKSRTIQLINGKENDKAVQSDATVFLGFKGLDVSEFTKKNVAKQYFIDSRTNIFTATNLIKQFADRKIELYFLRNQPAKEINLKQIRSKGVKH